MDVFESKLRDDGRSDACVEAFRSSYEALLRGESGTIKEADIEPATDIRYLEPVAPPAPPTAAAPVATKPRRASIREETTADPSLLAQTVVVKLNGGLGTSMGLDKAKSLLEVKDGLCFLDLICRQVVRLREAHGSSVRFMFMNSFSTSADTAAFLASRYPALAAEPGVELMQNRVPKVDAASLAPASWAANPELEWCPPGHGDLYASLAGSGKLDELLAAGVKYMFVSNSDNLGATLDVDLLTHFAHSDAPFLMEVCERTENDKKGGHLALRRADGRLILRESAQCADADKALFQDTSKHRFFNTNNLWVRLDRLRELLDRSGGIVPLPMIKNAKTVDPRDGASPAVFQLETAMGAAIECFDGADAAVVPRERFAPVKKCSDLLMLRSDAYALSDELRPALAAGAGARAPVVVLDAKRFKLVPQLEAATALGVPSLARCTRLEVEGPGTVHFGAGVTLVGAVRVLNRGGEPKTLPGGRTYTDETVDLTDAAGEGALAVEELPTSPIPGQKPGTSGLRAKTAAFRAGRYLHNFVQATLDALPREQLVGGTLVVSGDGRYFMPEALQVVVKMAAAAGVGRVWVGQHGLLSTPAVSAVVRERRGTGDGGAAFGAFILTASHNPGGPDGDFGVKYNCENGGPAPPSLTSAIHANTQTMSRLRIASALPDVDLGTIGVTSHAAPGSGRAFTVEVFDATEAHVALLKEVFDFGAIKALLARPGFRAVYDSMHGVNGPYARRVFEGELGAPAGTSINAVPSPTFGGHHADPNLAHATELCAALGVTREGTAAPRAAGAPPLPAFGAACDGDADRNMILGGGFFVTPSDSVAVIAANCGCIPFFRDTGGLKAVARSMPTSRALDRVAEKLGVRMFEVPTGWKFFGSLMDSKAVYGGEDFTPLICGEESFGTGSSHIREKDGLWAVLAWLSILAHRNKDAGEGEFVSVGQIVREHWREFGRNYYSRYDYEGVGKAGADAMMARMVGMADMFALGGGAAGAGPQIEVGGYMLAMADEFEYTDPVDGSVAKSQGIRFLFTDGSRVVFRLSGTGVGGATVRVYLERYTADAAQLDMRTADALEGLVAVALTLSKIEHFTGRTGPTVIT
eukprot:g2553.t1